MFLPGWVLTYLLWLQLVAPPGVYTVPGGQYVAVCFPAGPASISCHAYPSPWQDNAPRERENEVKGDGQNHDYYRAR